jgi:hypothetical protein
MSYWYLPGHMVPVYGMDDTRVKVWFLTQARQFYQPDQLWWPPSLIFKGNLYTRMKVDRARSWPLKSIYCQFKVRMWLTSPPPYAFMACIETTSPVFILPTQSHNQWDTHLIYFHQHFVLNILPMKLQYLRKIYNQVTQFKKLWRERNKNVQDHIFRENDKKK